MERAGSSEQWARVPAVLVGRLGAFDLAEESTEEAFATAVGRRSAERGPVPNGWLVTTERDRALERIGRDRTMASKAHLLVAEGESEGAGETTPIPDERLELTSTCWHPALAVEATVVLALRTPCGPTTPEIARVVPVPATAAPAPSPVRGPARR